MKVNTGVLRSAECDLRMFRNRVEGINDELKAVISAVADMKGIECYGKLKKISYNIEYSAYVLSAMSEVIEKTAEAYDLSEEKIVNRREKSYTALLMPRKAEYPKIQSLDYADYIQHNPSFERIANMIWRFTEGD